MKQNSRVLKDTFLHKGLRSKLVQALRGKKIKDERILRAFMDIPRHFFLDSAFAHWAYSDVAFPIEAEQTISHPYTVAFQTDLLQLNGTEKVLEIGTGSGFQACVLAHLGVKVYTIERQASLFHKTDQLLCTMGFERIRTLLGDGYAGAPRFAPYDRILVTCGATRIPKALFDQLKIGGIMVIPYGEGNDQEMLRITKISTTNFEKESFGKFQFVPFLEGVAD